MAEFQSYTVIIPTRDRRDMLSRALASVAAQTLLPNEVIVVDNSSTSSFIDGFALTKQGVQFEVLHAPYATNAAAVRNCGLRHTDARFIAFLDDDDAWLPGKMRSQLSFFHEHPECSAVVCGRLVVSPGAQFVEMPTTAQIKALLPYDNFGGSFSFIVFDRERCASLMLDERLEAFQDWDFLLQACHYGMIGAVPAVLAVYYDHPAPRITRKITGRRQALKKLYVNHQSFLGYDARRWMVSRRWDLRAQELSAGKEWRSSCHSVWRSLLWGWRCHLPFLLKYRSLGRRIALLFPPGIAGRCSSLVACIKAWCCPIQRQDTHA